MGGHSCYEGGHRAHGGPPSPRTRENLAHQFKREIIDAFKKRPAKEFWRKRPSELNDRVITEQG